MGNFLYYYMENEERSIYEIIESDKEKYHFSNDELVMIWSIGMSTWEDHKNVTYNDLVEFAKVRKKRKNMKILKFRKKD